MKKIKIVIVLLIVAVITNITESIVYASTNSATNRGKALIGFAEYNDFSSDDYTNMLDGASDETAVRLMGIFVSNWIEPGTSLPIRDLSQLTESITNIIVDNMKLPHEIASLYAGQIAYNMVYKSVNLNIYNLERKPLYYIKDYDATLSLLNSLGGFSWLSDEYGVYGYVDTMSRNVYFDEKRINGIKKDGYSYYNAVKTGQEVEEYLIDSNTSKAANGIVSLNDILFGNDYAGSGDLVKFWGSIASGQVKNSVTEHIKSGMINYDSSGGVVDKIAWIELRIADGDNKNKVVWNNSKVGCRLSGAIARNIIVTNDGNRSALLKEDGGTASGNKNLFVSSSSAYADEQTVLMVDPFGNILSCKGGSNSGNMVVPGCMNPYTFDSTGNKVVLSNNYTMGYLYPTETDNNYERNAFQSQLNFTFASIKRMKDNGLYKAAFVTSVRDTQDATNKMFKSITTQFDVEYIDNGGGYSDTSFKDFLLSFVKLKNFMGTYNFTMPVGLVEWAKSGKPYGNSAYQNTVRTINKIWEDNTASIDLVRYGGTWEFEGTWGSLINTSAEEGTEDGQLYVSSTICNDILKSTNKYGRSVYTTAGTSYVYGLYVLYAHIITGEDIIVEEKVKEVVGGEDQTGDTTNESTNRVTIATKDWGSCENLPSVDATSELGKKLAETVFGTVSEKQIKETELNVLKRINTILDPNENVGYTANLIGSITSSTVLSWHYDLLGLNRNTENSALMGNSGYSASNGYVTVPELEDISWLNYIISNYDYYLAIIMLVMSAILIVYIIVGLKSIQGGILTLFMFGFCLFCIPVIASYNIKIVNTVSNELIKDKFQYWVVTQQEAFISELTKAYEEGDVSAYLQKANAELIGFANGSSETTSVTWMTPKKDDYISQILGDIKYSNTSSSALLSNKSIMSTVRYLGTATLSGQKYINKNASYLLRSYTDISMYAKIMYEELANTTFDIIAGTDNIYGYFEDILSRGNVYYDENNIESIQLTNRANLGSGYSINDNIMENYEEYKTRYRLLGTSEIVNNAIFKEIKRVDIGSSNYDIINYGIDINYGDGIYKLSNIKNLSTPELATYQFLLYTESPFYYLFNSFADSGTMAEGNSTGFRSTVLGNNYILNDTYKDEDNNYATNDYVDFEGFFKYVLPFMRQANDVVINFDDSYGLTLHDTILKDQDSLETLANSADLKDELNKAWHNEMVRKVWNLYSPWADIMTESSYSGSEVIETMVGGRLVNAVLEDPLNPASYNELKFIDGIWYGRDMVFGEADMLRNGLKYSQLSSVEKKIYNILENSKEEIYSLLNYHEYDNQVLTTSAAMSVLFNFNKEFSDKRLFSESSTLYPQGYELKNFSYDAYLRTALTNSIGLPVTGTANLGVYATVLNNTNFVVGLLMCIDDIIGIYVLTYLKIIFVTLLVLLGILSLICSITVDDMKLIKTFKENVIVQNIQFLILALLHAFFTSILMGSTVQNVISTKSNILQVNNPVTVLVLLLILQLVVSYFYFRICLKMGTNAYKLAIKVGSSVGSAISSLTEGLATKTDGVSGGGISKLGSFIKGQASNAYMTNKVRRNNNRNNRRLLKALKSSKKVTSDEDVNMPTNLNTEESKKYDNIQRAIKSGKQELDSALVVNDKKANIINKEDLKNKAIYLRSGAVVAGRKILHGVSAESRYKKLKDDINNGTYDITANKGTYLHSKQSVSNIKANEKLSRLEKSPVRKLENVAIKSSNNAKLNMELLRLNATMKKDLVVNNINNTVTPLKNKISYASENVKRDINTTKNKINKTARKINNVVVEKPRKALIRFNDEVNSEVLKNLEKSNR